MSRAFGLAALFAAAAVLAAGGCGEAEQGQRQGQEQTPDDVAQIQSAIESANALSANALSANALSANALSANALSANALSANALSANALTAKALKDPLARQFLKYVVSCALPEGTSFDIKVDGKTYGFSGELGLAAEWGGSRGMCDGSCQRWVSACVLARVDFAGVKRLISLRGDHRALKTDARELRDYPVREATYYGNLFADGQGRFMCLSPDRGSNERVCGPSLAHCPMTVMGSCANVCQHRGRQGTFEDCATERSGRACDRDTIEETITVFLPQ
ncbi:MAG: hypothetical protein ABUS79_03755 [Pseudomonadota bacterium]